MGDKIGIWSLQATTDGKEIAAPLEELHDTETEKRLEDLLVESPDVLLPGLTLVGRQLPTEGGPLDLLGVDTDGRLVLFELKRGMLTREAVAQILDYASYLAEQNAEDLARLVEQNSGRNGIQPIEDFQEWYQGEFPEAADQFTSQIRLVLVGLGVDGRAKRVVNYLAHTGLDVQLLTFQAFRFGSSLFLARKVETVGPITRTGKTSGGSKQQNRRHLMELAREQGVEELLAEVADFIDSRVPGYRWPHKTAYTYFLAEQTEAGRPTQRAYVSLWVDLKSRGRLLLSLAERAIDAAPEAVTDMINKLSEAKRTESSWTPFELPIGRDTWENVREPLGTLIDAIVNAWKQKVEKQNAAETTMTPEDEETL